MTSNKPQRPQYEGRVLLLASSDEGETSAICSALATAALPVKVCGSLDKLRRALEDELPAVVIAGRVLVPQSVGCLSEVLSGHSNCPSSALIILSDSDAYAIELDQVLNVADNAVLLERPLCEATLVSAVRSSLRNWRRQRELLGRLAEYEKREQVARGSERELKQQKEALQQRVADRTAEAERRTKQLRALAAQLTKVEQRERRRLAQILHDQLQQLLVASRLKLGSIRRRLRSDESNGSFEQLDSLLDEAIEASRSLTVELSPPILYDAGLAAALEWLAGQTWHNHGLQVAVSADRRAEPADEELRILLFQAVRELLFNVVKHAKVDRAQLEMTKADGDRVQIRVIDAGVGFDPAHLDFVEISVEGFGLFNARERIESIGGHVEIDSAPGQGTKVTIVAPRHHLLRSADDADASSASTKKIRVLLADDHDVLREGLASIFSEAYDMELIGEAGDGQEAVELAIRTQPDVVVMDVAMPRLNGIEATRRILAALPQTRVVGLSMHKREDMEKAMREAGAVDYLPKGDSAEKLIDRIRENAAG
jgi:signal transduction histidine kinase/ActR/RegA family two-component response regulator